GRLPAAPPAPSGQAASCPLARRRSGNPRLRGRLRVLHLGAPRAVSRHLRSRVSGTGPFAGQGQTVSGLARGGRRLSLLWFGRRGTAPPPQGNLRPSSVVRQFRGGGQLRPPGPAPRGRHMGPLCGTDP